MDRKQCGYCFTGDDAYGQPCLYCRGTGFELSEYTKILLDPIQLAKKVMGFEHCRCDLVNGDHPHCPFHSKQEQAAS